jgi:hypothetical protein
MKKYFVLLVSVMLLVNASSAFAAYTSSGSVSCSGTTVASCNDTSSVSESWTSCAPGEFFRGMGINATSDDVHRTGANCFNPVTKTNSTAQSCYSRDGSACSMTANSSEDYAYCPFGWLLKGVGFTSDGGDIVRSIGKCYDPVSDITISNNYACKGSSPCTKPWDLSQIEAYVECTDSGSALSSVGFRAKSSHISGISHVCSNSRPPAPSGTISASLNPCTITAGNTTCTSNISWSFTNTPNACVYLRETSQQFACSSSNSSSPAPWITQAGFWFDLRAGNTISGQLLDSKKVTGNPPISPSTGSIQGLTYENVSGRPGVATQVSTAGATTANTNSPNFNYSFAGLSTGNRQVTATIPAGFSSAQWNVCAPGLVDTCHNSTAWNSGNVATVNVSAWNFVDLWFRFTKSVVLPPGPAVTVTLLTPANDPSFTSQVNGTLDAQGMIPVNLSWSFTDSQGTQSRYRVDVVDLDVTTKCNGNAISGGSCKNTNGTPKFTPDCMDAVVDFRNDGSTCVGTRPLENNKSTPGSAKSKAVYLKPNRHYGWRVYAISTVPNPDGTARLDTSVVFYFTTGSGTSVLPARDSQCIAFAPPASVTSGQTFNVTAVMKNTGLETWTRSPLGNHFSIGVLTDPFVAGEPPPGTWGADPLRIFLPLATSVVTNQSATFNISAVAPVVSTPTTMKFDWRMISRGGAWFGAVCSSNIMVEEGASSVGSIHGQTLDAGDSSIGVATKVRLVETGAEYPTLAVEDLVNNSPAGWYDFPGLDAGTYNVRIPALPAGYDSVEYSFCSVASEIDPPPDPCGTWTSGGANRIATVTVPAGGYINLNWRFTRTAQTGIVEIKRADKDGNNLGVNTYAGLDPSNLLVANPRTINNVLVDEPVVAFSTDLDGFVESVGTCSYAPPQSPCSVTDFSSGAIEDYNVGDVKLRSAPIDVQADKINRVVFKYTEFKVASCSATPSSVDVSQEVEWTASVVGGVSPFSYEWTFSNGETGAGNPVRIAYTDADISPPPQTASVIVTDATGESTPSRTCSSNVDVNAAAGGGTGELEVKWVGSDLGTGSAPNSAHIKIGSTGPARNSNPYSENNIAEGSYEIFAKDVNGYFVTAGLCITGGGETCASIDSFDFLPVCAGGYCKIDVDVVVDEKTRVVFLYERELDLSNARCELVPQSSYDAGTPINWFVNVPEDADIYSFNWNIPDADANPGDTQDAVVTFSDSGPKTASVVVTSLLQDSNSISLTCPSINVTSVGFNDRSINHDPTCISEKPINNKLPNTPECIEHVQNADGWWTHNTPNYDVEVSTDSISRVYSNSSQITVTPEGGFSDDIQFSVEGVYMDNLPTSPHHPDGLPDPGDIITTYPDGMQFLFKDLGPGGVSYPTLYTAHYSGDNHDYRFKFIVSILPKRTLEGRYIIVLKATSGSITAHERILLIVGEDTYGYVKET